MFIQMDRLAINYSFQGHTLFQVSYFYLRIQLFEVSLVPSHCCINKQRSHFDKNLLRTWW